MKMSKRRIVAALSMAMGMGASLNVQAGTPYVLGGSKAAQTGQASPSSMHNQRQDASVQPTAAVAQVGDQTPEGTVVSVTPVYAPGEEPGKASFDGVRGDLPAHGFGGPGAQARVTGEPTPIGVVQTNYNQANGRPGGMPAPTDVMAHGRSAGPGAMPPGMMPPGMMPQGQAPGMGMKPPRRGLMGLFGSRKAAAQDPYAVFNMNKAQRSMHAALPVGPQGPGPGPVNSVPASAVYGQKPVQ